MGRAILPRSRRAAATAFLAGGVTAAFLLCFYGGAPVYAEGAAPAEPPCPLTLDHYRGFIVKEIRVAPLLSFVPTGSVLDDALLAARRTLSVEGTGLEVDEPFTPRKLSLLQAELSEELRRRQLSQNSGFSLVTSELHNCRDTIPTPTLDVEYRVLTVAPPTYLTTSFEAHDRRDGDKRAAGARAAAGQVVVRPYVGYNESRGLFGGSGLSLRGEHALVNALDLNLSKSGHSTVADAALVGSREFSRGLLDYAEWRLGYAYSDVPADTLRLRDETFLTQAFGATRAFTAANLIMRAGANLEGGRHESNVAQADLPPDTVRQSAYTAGKLYVGASGAYGRHEWKVSYGLQIGNTRAGARLDYYRQIVDTAYRLRLMPRPHLPFQLDVQATAGLLGSLGGDVPAAERFFGGNVERTFTQGDAWRIRSNPVIRSFAENRLNDANGRPVGGDRFVALNVTLAQTVWSRPLLPREVTRVLVRDPDVTSALGGQLVTARLVLREGEIQRSSKELGALTAAVVGLEPTLQGVEAELASLDGLPDYRSEVIVLADLLATAKDTVENAKPVAAQPAATVTTLEEALSNAVETAAQALVRGDPDPDVQVEPQLEPLRIGLAALRDHLVMDGRAEPARRLGDTVVLLQKAEADIEHYLQTLEQLRAYAEPELATVLQRLDEPDPHSGHTLDQTLASIREALAPITHARQAGLKALSSKGGNAETSRGRERLQECVDLLTAADGYAIRAAADVRSAREANDRGRSSDAKNILEKVVVGFGGVPSHLGALVEAIGELEAPCQGDDLAAQWPGLADAVGEVRARRARAAASFARLHVPRYEAAVNPTVSYVGRVLDVFVNELNLLSVSPVLMLDIAKLRTSRLGGNDDPRYGVGLGLRLSLVNVDFTAGYSVNPDRRPREAPGAFVLALTINDLFR